jgi:hypothetical protein
MVVGKHDRLSRDQKRKAKLKKKAQRSGKHESLAYHGKKYQAVEYVPIVHQTEIGIYESYVVSGRTLTDDGVEASLEELIGELREGPRQLTSELDDVADDDAPEDLTIWSIRQRWQMLAERNALPGRDDLIGILRTLLHSLEIRRSMAMNSRGYLHFLEGFMKETGVKVELVSPDKRPLMGLDRPPLRGLPHDSIDDEDEE